MSMKRVDHCMLVITVLVNNRASTAVKSVRIWPRTITCRVLVHGAHGACSKNNQKVRYMPCTCVHTHCYRRVQAIPRTAAQKTTAHRATRTAHRAPGRLRVKLVQQITLAPIQRPVHVRTEWAWAKRRNKSIADGISACPWQRLAAWQQWPPVPAPLLWLRCCFYLNRC